MHRFLFSPCPHRKEGQEGFSLVELAIVLVILGLLVGGVMAGQSLVRASELRSVGQEAERYRTALYAFRDKYFAIPGDFRDATRVWGPLDGNDGLGVDCTAVESIDARTCNGDGNGWIGSTGTTGSSTYGYEMFRFWQHLANAGLVSGQYTGKTGTLGAAHHVPTRNSPAGKLAGSGWAVTYMHPSVGGTNDYATVRNTHIFQLGRVSTNSTPNLGLLTPAETWNIDTKIDDGVPGTGRIVIKYWQPCSMAMDQADVSAPYRLESTQRDCAIKFLL